MSKTPIFAVEQGCYSDYSVVAVFSTREAADRLCARLNKSGSKYDEATVAEWILDPGVEEMNAGLDLFLVRVLRDGTVEHAEEYDGFQTAEDINIYNRHAVQNGGKILIATVWAKDRQHAIKIVNERRGQMIAMGEWESAA